MSKNGSAQKAQDNEFSKSHLFVVKPNTKEASAKVVNFKASAEDTASEAIPEEKETVSVYDVIAQVNEKYISGERILPSEAARIAAEEVTPVHIEKPVQSIEDIKRKSEVLNRLSVKWDTLTEKRRKVENFAISHDRDTSSAIVRDSHGEVFESNSPKTISKLIEFWKAEFSEAIANVEKEMREIA